MSKPVISQPNDGVPIMGGRRLNKLTGADSDGQLAVSMARISPGFPGPLVHVHTDADEAFVVLEGELLFRIDGVDHVVGKGGLLYVPSGTTHGFTNVSGAEATAFEMFLPAGPDEYFAKVAEIVQRGASREEMIALMETYGMHVVGPPLGETLQAEAERGRK